MTSPALMDCTDCPDPNGIGSTREHSVRRLRLVRASAATGAVGALLYAPLPSELRLPAVPYRVSFVSEPSARNQPWHWFFQLTDVVQACLSSCSALDCCGGFPSVVALCSASRRLLCSVFSTSAVGMLALDCAPSSDAACRRAEIAGAVSAVHEAHTVMRVIGSVGREHAGHRLVAASQSRVDTGSLVRAGHRTGAGSTPGDFGLPRSGHRPRSGTCGQPRHPSARRALDGSGMARAAVGGSVHLARQARSEVAARTEYRIHGMPPAGLRAA
jgi:hypothetical protein